MGVNLIVLEGAFLAPMSNAKYASRSYWQCLVLSIVFCFSMQLVWCGICRLTDESRNHVCCLRVFWGLSTIL